MTAFRKAAVRETRLGGDQYVCLWPKVSVKEVLNPAILKARKLPQTRHRVGSRKLTFLNGEFRLDCGRSDAIFRDQWGKEVRR